MPYLSEKEFFDRAAEMYRSWSDARSKWQDIDEVLFSQHDLAIPKKILETGRARPVYSFLLFEKKEVAKSLLLDDDGPQISATSYGIGGQALKERDEVVSWLQSVLQWFEEETIDGIQQPTLDDHIVRGITYVRVTPNQEWTKMPLVGERRDDETLEEYEQRAKEVAEAQQALRHRVLPFDIEPVPAECCVPEESNRRLVGMWEFRQVPVADVLARFRDPETGEPLATNLAAESERVTLTDRHTCTLVIYSDEEKMQIGVTSLLTDHSYLNRIDAYAQLGGQDQIIFETKHGLGMVPYAPFPGRITSSRDPVMRYSGFLDPVVNGVQRYDEILTQLYSAGRISAWPSLIEEVERGALGAGGENPPPIEIEEGGVTILPAGHKLTNPQWTSSENYQHMLRAAQMIRHEIDMKTFSDQAEGAAATSGFQQSLVFNRSEGVLLPWERGAGIGWARVCQLALRCAKVLMLNGSGPIPVRLVGSDGDEYVTLRPAHVRREWVVRCKVRAKPVGGEAALQQTLANEINNGLLSRQTAMERLGQRNTTREQERIMLEAITAGPAVVQALQQVMIARFMRLASEEVAQPQGQMVGPQALAQATTDPMLRALLPAIPGLTDVPMGGPNPSVPPQGAMPPPPAGSGVGFGQQVQGVGGQAAGNPAGAGGFGSFQRGGEATT